MLRVIVLSLLGLLTFYMVAVGLFERFAPRRWVRAWQRFANRLLRPVTGFILGWATIETTGRRTGLRRRTPIGGRLRGDTFWCVAGDGYQSAFVLNIEADPRVRVRAHGRWRHGTARILPEDRALRRAFRSNPINGLFLWIVSKGPLTIRVDLGADTKDTLANKARELKDASTDRWR